MPFSRQPVTAKDRRRELVQQIVDRHSEQEQETIWKTYVGRLGSMAKHYIKTRVSLPEQMAELLEPGKLDEMVAADTE